MRLQGSHVSCGVQQVWGLDLYGRADGPILPALLHVLSGPSAPFMAMCVFSDADISGNGADLAAAIREVFGSKGLVRAANVNPNSGNAITTWVWAPDWRVVADWMDAQTVGLKEQKRAYSRDRVTKIRHNFREAASEVDDDDDWMEDDGY